MSDVSSGSLETKNRQPKWSGFFVGENTKVVCLYFYLRFSVSIFFVSTANALRCHILGLGRVGVQAHRAGGAKSAIEGQGRGLQ